jgi:hypothetical protein
VARELGDQRLDAPGQAQPALVEGAALGQLREQVAEPMVSDGKEPLVGTDAQHRLSNAQRDDLRVGDPSLAFPGRLGRRSSAVQNTAISSRSRSASIEAPLWSSVRESTADFDLPAYEPCSTTKTIPNAVAQLI